jgi:hypothetical protein
VSAVYNPEADTIARIEALELEARDIRRKIEHLVSPADQKVLNRQLKEINDEIQFLRNGLD